MCLVYLRLELGLILICLGLELVLFLGALDPRVPLTS